jgi:hypothetical protein
MATASVDAHLCERSDPGALLRTGEATQSFRPVAVTLGCSTRETSFGYATSAARTARF